MPLKTSAKRSLLQKNPAILVILRNNSLGPLDRVCIFGKYRKTTEIIKNRRQPVVYNGYILIYAFKLRTVSQLLRVAKKLFPYGFRLFAARRFRESFNFSANPALSVIVSIAGAILNSPALSVLLCVSGSK